MAAARRQILLLPGDGVGPEVVAQAKNVLQAVAGELGGLNISEADFGGCAIDKHGLALPDATLQAALGADAVLLGAVGGPQYDELPAAARPEKGLLGLRSAMRVYANLRPITCHAPLNDASALRQQAVAELDVLIVRELTGGIYFGEPRGRSGAGAQRSAFNTMRYSAAEVQRIADIAFAAASRRRSKLCSVDKANVLEVSMLWREVVTETADRHPGVACEHMYIDNAAMQLVRDPGRFDVILASNLFGDILSDLGAELAGSIGMMPSASLGEQLALYEPIHGSAPDIAGRDAANPCGAILSVAMMLEHSLDAPKLAQAVRAAVGEALADGVFTADICPAGRTAVSCSHMGGQISERVRGKLAA